MQLLTMDNHTIILVASSIMALTAIPIMNCVKSLTWQNNSRLILAIALIPISIIAIYLTKEACVEIASTDPSTINRLWITLFFMGTHFLISSVPISFVAYEREGFANLKKISESGLVSCLASGLVVGLTLGLIGGLSIESVGRSVDALFFGLTLGSVFGLVLGLAIGLDEEYKNKPKNQTSSS